MSDTNQNEKGDWKDREIGALWLRRSAAGNKYLSGHITSGEDEGIEETKERVIVFANKDKKNDKAPDYRIYKSSPQQATVSASQEDNQETETQEDELDVL
tara:strand:+ start:1177 stop:1476 length:300 start_codon:yes stop_codon:yes gene_type:complete